MKSTLIRVALAAAAAGTPNTWHVGGASVRVTCPMTIGGSFDAKTTALSGSLLAVGADSTAFEGVVAVDLRTLDTGIDLRNDHLRESYLEVDKGSGFETAILTKIAVHGLNLDGPGGSGSFTGLLTLHGVTRGVAGSLGVRHDSAGLRVKAVFPVALSEFGIPAPRYLGVGVKDIVQVEVVAAVTQGAQR